jgi:hypothetical protein
VEKTQLFLDTPAHDDAIELWFQYETIHAELYYSSSHRWLRTLFLFGRSLPLLDADETSATRRAAETFHEILHHLLSA